MRLGELKALLAKYPDELPIYGHTNVDPWDPCNRFEICNVEHVVIDHVHYKEPVLTLEWNVL